MKRTHKQKFDELRRRAEALLQNASYDRATSNEETKTLPDLIHELEVHQVELEMQNEELRRTEQRLTASEKKFADLYNFAPIGYFSFDRKGTILETNLTGASLLGLERQRLIGTHFPAYCTPQSADQFYLHVGRVLKTQQSEKCELTLKRQDGSLFDAQLESVAAQNTHDFFIQCQSVLIDITEHKAREREQAATVQLLHLINISSDTRELIENITRSLKDWTGCEAIGVRANVGPDYPFFATQGYPPDLAATENSLIARNAQGQPLRDDEGRLRLECLCGLIVRGWFDPARPYFTARGSFWTNSTSRLLAGLNALEKKELGPMRSRCALAGYESTAIIPLRFGGEVLGLLQINDKRVGRFTPRLIAFLENLADRIAMTLAQRQADAALRDSEAYGKAILDSVVSNIAVLDHSGVIRVVNGPWQRFALENQHPAGEPPLNCGVGVNYLDLCRRCVGGAAEGAMVAHDGIQAVLEGHLPSFTLEYPCDSPNEKRWFSMSVTPLGNELRGVVVSHTDITVRKQAEEVLRDNEERLRLATVAADLGTWDFDGLTGEVKWSERCNAAFGLPPEAKVDYETFITLVHPEDRQRVDETSRGALDPSGNGECKYEYRVLWPDGAVHWISSLGQAFFENIYGVRRAVRCIGTIADITARKQAEEQLRLQGEQLVEADRRKNEFLSMLAHELRNPLAPIRNAVLLLRRGIVDEQAVKRQGEMIERQVRQMARLLDDLLDISRITQGKISLKQERLDLRAVVDRALETSMHFINEHHHSLHYDPLPEPLWLDGDGPRLEQVVCNLLNNAIKYTEPGGQIWVTLEREASAGDPANTPIALRIRDSGIGIAPEMLQRVFDLFSQAERSLDRAQGGLGIGLNLVRRLVALHGGTIEAHSAGLGQGSEFVVRLPLSPAPETASTTPESLDSTDSELPGMNSQGPAFKVLIVEDNVDGANSLGELVEQWGYPLRLVYDGAAALPVALEFKPDVVLLDLGLPGLSGCEVAPLLRAQPTLAATRIIALTGYGQEEDRRRALVSGFDDYLIKPVDLKRLYALLQQHPVR